MAVVKKKRGAGSKPRQRRAEKSDTAELTLPDAPSTPLDRLQDYTMLLFGEKKIGKTSLAAKFPKTFFMMTEPGGKALAINQRPVTTWREAEGYVRLLEKDGGRFDTICVDTVDLLYKLAEARAIQRLGIDHPSEGEWGRGWSAVRDTFTPLVQRMMSMGKGVVFISHAVEREVKKRDGSKYDRIQPTLSGQGRDVVEGMVDIWCYYHYDGDKRSLQIKGDDHVGAGHRLQDDHFRWKGKEVKLISMGASPDEAYANLIACFNNQYNPADGETPEPEAKVKFTAKKKPR